MPTKPNNLKILLPALLVLAIVAAAFVWFTYGGKPAKKAASSSDGASSKQSLQIDTSAYKNVTNPTDSSQEISPNESGFGRDNPFAPYK